MVSSLRIAPHTSLPKPRMGQDWGISRAGLDLTADRLSDVFRVFDGSVVLIAAFMEITTAVSNNANTMSWVFDSDAGGDRVIGSGVTIQAAALGDFIYAELDATALVKPTTSTGLISAGYLRGSGTATNAAASIFGYGQILTSGGIDIVLATNSTTTGTGTMTCVYRPLVEGAMLAPEDMVQT